MPDWLIPVIVIDLVITAVVVGIVLHRRSSATTSGPNPSGHPNLLSIAGIKAMARFSTEKHQRVGEYVRANWSGMPEQLPAVLQSLLDEFEREAKSRQVDLSRDLLKILLVESLRRHRIGRDHEVRDAMERVA